MQKHSGGTYLFHFNKQSEQQRYKKKFKKTKKKVKKKFGSIKKICDLC